MFVISCDCCDSGQLGTGEMINEYLPRGVNLGAGGAITLAGVTQSATLVVRTATLLGSGFNPYGELGSGICDSRGFCLC